MKKDKLHNVKSTGFKTPDHYFESFEDKLFERLTDKEAIEDIEDPGYAVPKDYFDSIDNKVFNKLNTTEKSVINLKSKKAFYYVAGIAASLVLLFAVFINNETPEESISVEMVETYLENQDLDSYELAQLLTDADVLEDDFTIIETNYNEDNLESYLLDNADIETIIEQ